MAIPLAQGRIRAAKRASFGPQALSQRNSSEQPKASLLFFCARNFNSTKPQNAPPTYI
jgi:hypothetical protein